ncbi:MAG: response regulator [Microcoleus sp. SM1_3_4]|nr:response regulator [Microcoleus sp. SM1_3_4]
MDEIELLQEIINRVFPRIERARAEEALRESEANYRSLFNTMDQGFCIIEKVETATGQPSDFRYITVNPAFERHTGLSNVVGRTMREFLPNSEQQIVDIYDAVVRTREPQQFEEYVAELDLWFETEVFPAQLSGQIAVLFSNVSDRKQAEAQLRRAAEMDAFRVKLSDALRALSDPLQIQAQACRVLGEQLGIDRAYYVEVHEAEGYARVNQHYSRGDSPSIVGDYPLAEYGWSMQIMRRGETIVVADTQSSNIVPDAERAAMAMLQMVGFVALPPIKGEVLVGALTLNEPAPREWTEAEVELVSETAERIWADIQRAYAETALHESELQRVREQSEREQERQRAEALAELDRAKTLFFSNVSHEFRTPLTLILNPLEEALVRLNSENAPDLDGEESAARSPDLPRYLQESLQVARRNSLRLLKLVNTLLDFSRIEADRLQATYEPTDLASYTAELASVFRSAIENAGLQLIVNCPPLPEPIYVDRGMWEKIVINLLSNAFKFTFSGTITVALDRKTDAVQLKVSDTGTGIPTSELPRLFDRFYQVKGARGRSYEGSGIGLSLVQELVKLHGGSIAVTSTVGEGTSFTVTIPTGTAHLAGDRIAVASGKPSATVTTDAFVEEAMRWLPEEGWHDTDFDTDARMNYRGVLHESDLDGTRNQEENQILPLSPSQGGHGGTAPTARILLADDNADMRDYLRRLLGSRYDVTAVADGAAALAAIRQAPPDLVLADVMMPEMDGFELLRSLRADPQTQAIPIVLLSARAGEEWRVEGLEIGADDYLIKPFSARELLARVDAHLQLAQMRREVIYQEEVTREVQAMNDRLEQQVSARTAQLEAVNEELEAFASAVSHDLRTPLRYINSFADRLRDKLESAQVDAKSLQSLSIIAQSARSAEKMVADLLEFSRLGQTKMRVTTVMMERLVEQVRAQLMPELAGRSLHWQIEPLPEIAGDPILLQLVMQNLLSNAIKYTANRESAEIAIGSIDREEEVIFFVRDNGAGFDMKYRHRLFAMFGRLHSQEQFAGTGVGLATVRRIIHRHGGRIWAEGAIDRGATFYFSLPKREVATSLTPA